MTQTLLIVILGLAAGFAVAAFLSGRRVEASPNETPLEARVTELEQRIEGLREEIEARGTPDYVSYLRGESHKEAYFNAGPTDGTFLLNIRNFNPDGELGIRFWKGDTPNQWCILVPGNEPYKLAIIRDALIDAFVLDEQGRLILGQMAPNVYGPALARFHVKGEIDEVQARVEASDNQTADVFHVVSSDGVGHLSVTADGDVEIGESGNRRGIILHDVQDGSAHVLRVDGGALSLTAAKP